MGGLCGGFGFAEPTRLEQSHLPDPFLRYVLAPLRDRAWGDPQQLGERGCVASQFDCLLRLHSERNFSTLNIKAQAC